MTRLFIRFYLGVLAVLFMAWYIHGTVLESRSRADLARVILEAHAGGARLVAGELDAADDANREALLGQIQSRFAYPVRVHPVNEAPAPVLQELSGGLDVAYHRQGDRHYVIATCSNQQECVWLGPFPNYRLQEIENAIAGWMRLAVKQIEAAPLAERHVMIESLRQQFEISIQLVPGTDLPDGPRTRIDRGQQIVFYEQGPRGSDQFFSATPVSDSPDVLRFGPFPSFQRIEQKAATTTLALVLLPAAFAIALLLRPVAQQLRHVENAAKSIAGGDLNARVSEKRVRAAQPLAQAFNLMADRTESLLRSQKELLQAVSHELRTPLARIQFAAELIQTAKTDEERDDRLASINDATQQLDDLVGQLLTYVRADSGSVEISPESVSVLGLLQEVIDTTAPLYPSLQFTLSPSSDDVTVVIDRAGVNCAISNLVRNAARFARSEVALSAKQDGRTAVLTVEDDGPGVAEEDRERIFQPFVRLSDNADGGSGLGLALVSRIVQQHGGQVSVANAPGGGARFMILLDGLNTSKRWRQTSETVSA